MACIAYNNKVYFIWYLVDNLHNNNNMLLLLIIYYLMLYAGVYLIIIYNYCLIDGYMCM